MSTPWDNAAQNILGQFDSGFEEARSRRLDREHATRQTAQDKIAADEREYGHRKDLGFENPQSQGEAMFRDRMMKKEALANAATEAHTKNELADAGMRDRSPVEHPAHGGAETGIAAKLAATDNIISDIDTREGKDSFPRNMWPGNWGTDVEPGDAQLRTEMKANRLRLVRGGPGAPAPAAHAAPSRKLTPQQQDAYLKARTAGKSEAEARALAGG